MHELNADQQAALRDTLGVPAPGPVEVSHSTLQWIRAVYPLLAEEDRVVAQEIFGVPEDRFIKQWFERCEELIAFRHEHGRMPTDRVKPGPEKSLNTWMKLQRVNRENLTDSQVQFIETQCPEILNGTKKTWDVRLLEVHAFHKKHGRLPKPTSSNSSEKVLGRWVFKWLAKKALSDKQKEMTARLLPEFWGELSGRALTFSWNERLVQVAEFVTTNGRFPSLTSADADVHVLTRWVYKWRTKKEKLTRDQVDEIDRLLPTFWDTRSGGAGVDIWNERLVQVAEFVAAHERFPSSSTRADPSEKSLAYWVYSWRLKKDRLTSDQRSAVNRLLPTFWDTQADSARSHAWNERLVQLVEFVSIHERFPARNNADEKTLAGWMSKQRKSTAKHTPERLASIDKHCPALLAGTAWERANRPEAITLAA